MNLFIKSWLKLQCSNSCSPNKLHVQDLHLETFFSSQLKSFYKRQKTPVVTAVLSFATTLPFFTRSIASSFWYLEKSRYLRIYWNHFLWSFNCIAYTYEITFCNITLPKISLYRGGGGKLRITGFGLIPFRITGLYA